MTDSLDRKKSVTAEDQAKAQVRGDIVSIVLAPPEWGASLAEAFNTSVMLGLPLRSQYNRRRDALLRGTLEMDSMWAAAISKATTKQVALGWKVEDGKDIKTRAEFAQDLIGLFDGDFEQGIQRGLQDYLTTDNGQWVEVIRATKGAGSRVTGLAHLDSLRVTRTGDPDIPAVYTTLQGRDKPLYSHQCLNLTAMPSPDVSLRGVGFCAASAAWPVICKMQALEVYFTEKVTGRRSLAIHLIRGINHKQLTNALATAENDQQQRGYIHYRGAVLIPGLDAAEEISVTTIPIADIPDGFDIGQERERADNIYANTIGIFVGELRPLTGQGLGNGQQARVLEEAAEGVGLSAWRKQWVTALKAILPRTTTFRWSSNDDGDRKRKAEADGAVVSWLATAVEKLGLPPASAQQLMLDHKILPPELAPADATPGGTLTDEEQAPTPEAPEAPTNVPELAPVAEKAAEAEPPGLDAWGDALAWARLALAGEGEPAATVKAFEPVFYPLTLRAGEGRRFSVEVPDPPVHAQAATYTVYSPSGAPVLTLTTKEHGLAIGGTAAAPRVTVALTPSQVGGLAGAARHALELIGPDGPALVLEGPVS